MPGANLNAAENDLELLIFLGHRVMGMCLYQLAGILLPPLPECGDYPWTALFPSPAL